MANAKIDDFLDTVEQRFEALESRNVFQDDVIEQLSEELAIHQAKIAELKDQLKLMAMRLKDASSSSEGIQEVEPPPPHF